MNADEKLQTINLSDNKRSWFTSAKKARWEETRRDEKESHSHAYLCPWLHPADTYRWGIMYFARPVEMSPDIQREGGFSRPSKTPENDHREVVDAGFRPHRG